MARCCVTEQWSRWVSRARAESEQFSSLVPAENEIEKNLIVYFLSKRHDYSRIFFAKCSPGESHLRNIASMSVNQKIKPIFVIFVTWIVFYEPSVASDVSKYAYFSRICIAGGFYWSAPRRRCQWWADPGSTSLKTRDIKSPGAPDYYYYVMWGKCCVFWQNLVPAIILF